MGVKKANKFRGGFSGNPQQQVASATLDKFRGYIDQKIQAAANSLMQYQTQQFKPLVMRMVALENFLFEKFPELNKETLSDRIADAEDALLGFEESKTGVVEAGDRVRLLVVETQDGKSTTNRFVVDNIGSGQSLTKDVETSLLGTPLGETKTLLVGPENAVEAKITIKKILKQPEPDKTEETNES